MEHKDLLSPSFLCRSACLHVPRLRGTFKKKSKAIDIRTFKMPSTAYLHTARASPALPPCVVATDGPACPSGMIACRLQASAGCYRGSSANIGKPFQLQACVLPQGRYAPSPSQQPCQCANCRSFALASERPPMMRSTFARQSSKQLLHVRRCFCMSRTQAHAPCHMSAADG